MFFIRCFLSVLARYLLLYAIFYKLILAAYRHYLYAYVCDLQILLSHDPVSGLHQSGYVLPKQVLCFLNYFPVIYLMEGNNSVLGIYPCRLLFFAHILSFLCFASYRSAVYRARKRRPCPNGHSRVNLYIESCLIIQLRSIFQIEFKIPTFRTSCGMNLSKVVLKYTWLCDF